MPSFLQYISDGKKTITNSLWQMEDDIVGRETLEVISDARRFNEWMYQQLKPFCGRRVLEIGSGIGNISKHLFEDGFEVLLSDFNPLYCESLKESYGSHPNCLSVESIDLIHPEFDSRFKDLANRFDTVFALNVIEHIEDDILALQNAMKLLKKSGTLFILVPSYKYLYSPMDEKLGHYRRYTVPSLSDRFNKANLEIIHTQYFNAAGILGWFISSKLLKDEQIKSGKMKLFNRFVPAFKLLDAMILNKIGLSTIVVGRK